MSRIGKKLIELPAKVTVKFGASGEVNVEGPKGKLAWTLPGGITGKVDGKNVTVHCDSRTASALHGLSRSLINNMVNGVANGYVRDLEIQGVGFKAAVKGNIIQLNLGYSHEINHPIPDGIKVTVTDQTKVRVEGIDKKLVGQVAADIRGYYPPEPYKGKGVRYVGEQIIRKEGKTVQ
ncbi:MAG: 50S ribosomal protein L6 [Chthoniobacteraceae bacterium]